MKKLVKGPFPEEVNLFIIRGSRDSLITHKFSLYPRGGKNIHRIMVKFLGHLGLIEAEILLLIYDILSGRFKGGNEGF